MHRLQASPSASNAVEMAPKVWDEWDIQGDSRLKRMSITARYGQLPVQTTCCRVRPLIPAIVFLSRMIRRDQFALSGNVLEAVATLDLAWMTESLHLSFRPGSYHAQSLLATITWSRE